MGVFHKVLPALDDTVLFADLVANFDLQEVLLRLVEKNSLIVPQEVKHRIPI